MGTELCVTQHRRSPESLHSAAFIHPKSVYNASQAMKILPTLIAVTSLVAGLPSLLSSQTLKTVALFDGTKTEFPESIAVDHRGNLYLSLVTAGKIKKVTPEGAQSDFARISDTRLLGVNFDRTGNLLVVGTSGVWKVSPAGVPALFASIPDKVGLNDVVPDQHGNLYVTDPSKFVIWKVDRQGNAVLWSSDPLFQPAVGAPTRLGPNGIGFTRDMKTLHVNNTSAGRLLAIDIRKDGSAAPARILAESPLLVGADGLEIDHHDNTYIAVNRQNRIARVSRKGELSTVVEGDLLSAPTSLTFGRGHHAHTLFICNNGGSFFGPNPVREGVLRLDFKKLDKDHDSD